MQDAQNPIMLGFSVIRIHGLRVLSVIQPLLACYKLLHSGSILTWQISLTPEPA